jgi:hypothetical protein
MSYVIGLYIQGFFSSPKNVILLSNLCVRVTSQSS